MSEEVASAEAVELHIRLTLDRSGKYLSLRETYAEGELDGRPFEISRSLSGTVFYFKMADQRLSLNIAPIFETALNRIAELIDADSPALTSNPSPVQSDKTEGRQS